jgi:8-amino-7-oxononanoate synthase
LLSVDDAHGLGVLGDGGGGSVEYFGLTPRQVPALVGTLGKAFGSFGAFVAGDAGLIETLIQRARTYIYTTALPVAVAAATGPRSQSRLPSPGGAHACYRSRAASARSQPTPEFRSGLGDAIQPILLGGAEAAVAASRRLLERGFFVAGHSPATVPDWQLAPARRTLGGHRDADVEGLVAALAEVLARE